MVVATVSEWWDRYGDTTKLDKINEIIAAINANASGKLATDPDYDSNWFALASGSVTKTHDLDTDNLLIQVLGKDTGSEGIMNIRVGGIGGGSGFRGGYYKNVTTTQITVQRESGDALWDQWRIQLWKLV